MSTQETFISDEEIQYLTVAEVVKEIETSLYVLSNLATEEKIKGTDTSIIEGGISALSNLLYLISYDAKVNKNLAEIDKKYINE